MERSLSSLFITPLLDNRAHAAKPFSRLPLRLDSFRHGCLSICKILQEKTATFR